MKSVNIIFLMFLITTTQLNSQIIIKKKYGGNGFDSAKEAIECSDNNYLIAGSTQSFENLGRAYLIKINPFGDTIWTRNFGEPNRGEFIDVIETSSQEYLMIGSKDYSRDIYLVKTKSNGDSLWTKTISPPLQREDYPSSIIECADKNYLIVGNTIGNDDYGNDIFSLKVNTSGETVWRREYKGYYDQKAYSVVETENKDILIAGSNKLANGDIQHYLIKTNARGDTLWTKSFGQNDANLIKSVIISSDNFVFITGMSKPDNKDDTDLYVAKMDLFGNIIWSNIYGGFGSDIGESIAETQNGKFIITGWTNSFEDSSGDIYFLKINSDGEKLCSKAFGENLIDFGRAIFHSSDDHYVIVGDLYSDICFIKLAQLSSIHLSPQTVICGEPIKLEPQIEYLDDESNLVYNWYPSELFDDPNLKNPTAVLSDSLFLKFNVTDGKYSLTDSVYVNVSPIEINMDEDRSLVCGSTTQLSYSLNIYNWDGLDAKWTPSGSLDSDTLMFPLAIPFETTTYELLISKGKCIAQDSIKITVEELTADLGSNKYVECGDSLQLFVDLNSSANIYQYRWEPSVGLNNDTIRNPWIIPTKTDVYKIKVNYKNCNAEDSLTINYVPANFSLDFTVDKQLLTSPPFVFQFSNTTSLLDKLDFIWHFGDGDSLVTNNETVFHEYKYNGLYDVSLIAIEKTSGCKDTLMIEDYLMCAGGQDSTVHTEQKTSEIEVYPNPFVHSCIIVPPDDFELEKVRVFNTMGEEVHCEYIKMWPNIKIYRRELVEGMYYFKLYGNYLISGVFTVAAE